MFPGVTTPLPLTRTAPRVCTKRIQMKLSNLIVASLLAMLTTTQAQQPSLAPEFVIVNASIHTMDAARPTAGALAIAGNRIMALGATTEIRSLAGAKTRVVDANQRTVLPGFNDAHVHWLMGGFSITNVDLRDATSPQEFARRIGEHAKNLPKGRWILGGDWDHEKWPGTPLPAKEMIDAVTPDHPVFVNRTDGHMALANSLALKLAKVTKETKEVPGGLIVRDANGEPTGVLKDAAMDLVDKVIPARSWDEKHAAALAATEHAAKAGVTSVQDMSAGEDVGLYQYMLEHGELKTRIYGIRSIVSWEVLG